MSIRGHAAKRAEERGEPGTPVRTGDARGGAAAAARQAALDSMRRIPSQDGQAAPPDLPKPVERERHPLPAAPERNDRSRRGSPIREIRLPTRTALSRTASDAREAPARDVRADNSRRGPENANTRYPNRDEPPRRAQEVAPLPPAVSFSERRPSRELEAKKDSAFAYDVSVKPAMDSRRGEPRELLPVDRSAEPTVPTGPSADRSKRIERPPQENSPGGRKRGRDDPPPAVPAVGESREKRPKIERPADPIAQPQLGPARWGPRAARADLLDGPAPAADDRNIRDRERDRFRERERERERAPRSDSDRESRRAERRRDNELEEARPRDRNRDRERERPREDGASRDAATRMAPAPAEPLPRDRNGGRINERDDGPRGFTRVPSDRFERGPVMPPAGPRDHGGRGDPRDEPRRDGPRNDQGFDGTRSRDRSPRGRGGRRRRGGEGDDDRHGRRR